MIFYFYFVWCKIIAPAPSSASATPGSGSGGIQQALAGTASDSSDVAKLKQQTAALIQQINAKEKAKVRNLELLNKLQNKIKTEIMILQDYKL